MNEELKKILYGKDSLISRRVRLDFFKKNHNTIFQKIDNSIPNDYGWKEKLYISLHEIEHPKCKTCGNLKFVYKKQ